MLQNHLRVNAMLTSPAFFLALTLVAKHRFIQKDTQTLAPRGEIASAMVTAAHHFAHRFEPNNVTLTSPLHTPHPFESVMVTGIRTSS